jgi:hypothetical protein
MTPWNEAQNVLLFSPLRASQLSRPETGLQAQGGLREPPQSARSEADLHLPETIDLILVPGLAFSKIAIASTGRWFSIACWRDARRGPLSSICFPFKSRIRSDRLA